MALFGKKRDDAPKPAPRKSIPEGLWEKCRGCNQPIFKKILAENLYCCPKCNYHFSLGAYDRIQMLCDLGSFHEYFTGLQSTDPLQFKGPKTYVEKLADDMRVTGMKEACVTGTGKINGFDVACGVTDSRFIMGSMGSVVGEKLTRVMELAGQNRFPLVIVSGSGGGARMYEGMLSLMQMAKTSAQLARYHQQGGFFISILTDPTMAGVMASYASLGDVIMAEPKALIGFTGPRVIEQTIRQKLPKGFQRSEFLLQHGLIDRVVHRKDMKSVITTLISHLFYKADPPGPQADLAVETART